MKKIKILIVIVGLVFASCSQEKLPKGFPDKKEFAQILAEVHYAEATISQSRIINKGSDSLANSYYHHALAKFNLTQEKFDTIVNWYLTHPKLYQDVYDEAVGILTERETEWQNKVKEIEEEEALLKKEKAARNVWQNKRNYFVSMRDTSNRQIPFEIIVDTIDNAKGYRFSANYQFLKGSRAESPAVEMISMYEDSTQDTVYYKLTNTHVNTKAELQIGVDSVKKIINIKGLLIKHDTLEEIRARVKDIEFEYIPMDDSIQLEVDTLINAEDIRLK